MADELRYVVKIGVDEASFKSTQDKLDGLTSKTGKSVATGPPAFRVATADLAKYGQEANSALKKLVALDDQIRKNAGSIRVLKKLADENTESGAIAARKVALLTGENKILSAEYRIQQSVLNANKGAVDASAMSYNQMQARIKELGITMKDIVPSTEEQIKLLADMQAESDGLNNKIKAFDKTIGNNQRNVGNYTDIFREFASGIAIFQGPLGPIAGRLNALATTLNKLSESEGDNEDSTKKLGVAKRIYNFLLKDTIKTTVLSTTATNANTFAMRASAVAIGGVNRALKVLKLALATTGIGALIVGISSLAAFFTAGERGAFALERRLAPFKAMGLVLRDTFADLGIKILNTFTSPLQTIKDLSGAVLGNLVTRVVSVGKIFKEAFIIISKGSAGATMAVAGIFSAEAKEKSKELFAETGESFTRLKDSVTEFNSTFTDFKFISNLKTRMQEAGSQAGILTEQMQAVVIKEREIEIARAAQNARMRETMAIARDESKSVQERLSAVRMIAKAEDDMFEMEVANEQERLRVLTLQATLAHNNTLENETLIAQQVKLSALEQTHFEKKLTTLETIKMLTAQGGQRELSVLRANLSAQQLASDLAIKMVEDRMIREGKVVELAQMKKDAFEANFLRESEARYKAYVQENLNQFFSAADSERMARQRVDDEMAIERLDVDKEVSDATIARAQATADAKISINKTQAEADRDTQIEMFTRQGRHAKASALIMEKIELDKQEKILALKQEFIAKGIGQDEALKLATAQINADSEKSEESETRRLEDAKFEHKMKMLNAYSSLVTVVGEAIFKDNKAFAVASAIIDTYGAMNRTRKQYPYPLNIPFIAADGLAGFANVRKILATKKGTKGGSASAGSVPSQSVGTSFGLVDVGTNQSAAAFVASQQSAQSQGVNVYLQGEFDPEYLSLKVAQGNNSLAQRTVRIG